MKKYILGLSMLLFVACKPAADQNVEEKKRTEVNPATDLSNDNAVPLNNIQGTATTYDDLIAANKGKVIYVDVWASWCGPCKAMMPASAALKNKFKDKNVAFIYLSIDQNAAAWKASSAHFKIDAADSFIATNYPKGFLFQNYNVSSIPRYFLYDRKGRMMDDDALRPNQPDLANTIENLLKY